MSVQSTVDGNAAAAETSALLVSVCLWMIVCVCV